MYKVLVWGSGKYYEAWGKWIPDDYNIVGFIHGDTAYQNTYYEGKLVYAPQDILHLDYDKIVVAASHKENIYKKLKQIGVEESKIEQLEFNSQTLFDNLMPNRKSIKTFYAFNQNVGDLLNSFLQDYIFSIRTEWTDLANAELISIGSLLNLNYLHDDIKKSEKPIYVWGTGFMDSPRYGDNKFYRPVLVNALRGRLSLQIIEDILGCNVDCPLADPGLLCSKLGIKSEKKMCDVGIIPHYREINNPIFKNLLHNIPNSILINMREHPRKVIEEISSCRTILSNSLHGLIIADSFLIPNWWIRIEGQTIGNSLFKYWDYYSSYKDIVIQPLRVMKNMNLRAVDIENNYQITRQMVLEKQKQLLQSWPFEKGN